jgi:CRP-like cAMP-binding protein
MPEKEQLAWWLGAHYHHGNGLHSKYAKREGMPKVALLKKGFLFQNLADADISRLADRISERWVNPEQFVFHEGAAADSMFVIQEGTVEIVKEGRAGAKLVVALLQGGAHFGEMSFVDRAPRAASAMVRSRAKLLELKYDDLETLVSTRPELGLKLYHAMAKTLCERIRATTSDLTHLMMP